jgi:hypothetical protein
MVVREHQFFDITDLDRLAGCELNLGYAAANGCDMGISEGVSKMNRVFAATTIDRIIAHKANVECVVAAAAL